MKPERRLLISFSGGETSAFMTLWILRHWRSRYDRIVIVFANTGEENEETLDFIRLCDERLDFGTVWIEAVVNPQLGKGPGFRVVTFETASRNGEPFEAFIAKYGIPNPKFKGCTRVLKRQAIEAYCRSLGWGPGSYDLAIGIRADEIDRMTSDARDKHIVYPLVSARPTTKPEINTFWARQNFRLRLKGYQSNCKTCWKKSLRKLLTIMDENPSAFDFNRRMEAEYSLVGPEFIKDAAGTLPIPLLPGYRRVFFRENKSTADLEAMLAAQKAAGTFRPAEDDTAILGFDFGLDTGGGCGESCEVFSDGEDEDPEPEAMEWAGWTPDQGRAGSADDGIVASVEWARGANLPVSADMARAYDRIVAERRK